MATVNLQSHLKLFQKLDVFLFELVRDVLLHEQLADFGNPYKKISLSVLLLLGSVSHPLLIVQAVGV